ncbi:hypothetical protein SAMN04487964_11258 [Marinobacterium sediminicola]|uniref:Uncharacterized protein n=1 Tax=Marinobacterium sediminicola TaxID=518898 RepID=A0ABY1S2M4_9GAMM|nr:hypothetical protein SAMN04487964_11258 [Marinobacterium sediminicola]
MAMPKQRQLLGSKQKLCQNRKNAVNQPPLPIFTGFGSALPDVGLHCKMALRPKTEHFLFIRLRFSAS